MGPSRRSQAGKAGERGSTEKQSQSDRKPRLGHRQQNASDIPGVQKIKSSLRQTRRFLAKDNLAADVRVETERRLKALEGDLAVAERRSKERSMATKYHKVKFFEKKKLLRKIVQVKNELESTTPSTSTSKQNLERTLAGLRVDLNYILHYPKMQKYISLFSTSAKDEGSSETRGEDASQEPTETDMRRRAIRDDVKRRMEEGELSTEPELEAVPTGKGAKRRTTLGLPEKQSKPSKYAAVRPSSKDGARKASSNSTRENEHLKGDDFFDLDESGDSSSESG